MELQRGELCCTKSISATELTKNSITSILLMYYLEDA